MAFQIGLLKLRGTLGDITFYKSKDGYIAKEKTSLDKARIETDPNFQRTRENGAEFGRAGQAGKFLRNAFAPSIKRISDSKMVGRLTKLMLKVIQADIIDVRGERNVINGDLTLLKRFEFNAGAILTNTLKATLVSTIDRVSGDAEIKVDPFIPNVSLMAPEGTTHYRIYLAAAAVDFASENGAAVYSELSSEVFPYGSEASPELTITVNIGPNSLQPIFSVVGVEFYQELNGMHYTLNNGAFNALSIVDVLLGD